MIPVSDVKESIINAYLKFVEKNKKHPTRADMLNLGYNRDKIRCHFNSQSNLRKTVKNLYPEAFSKIIDETLFSKKNFDKLKGEVAKYNKFVITTAVNGCEVDQNFLKSLETYCKVNKAALLILPSNDPAHNLDNNYMWNFDPILIDKKIVFDDLQLNSNLFISSIRVQAKHIDPITGLERVGCRNGSFIFASPKQRLKYIPVGNNKHPHALMTTGAITKPNYKTTKFCSERTAYLAHEDHIMGGIVVEIVDNQFYHFRQIQAEKSGAFIDLTSKYDGSKITNVKPEAIVLGDWHTGDTDPVVAESFYCMVDELQPKYLIVHDIFNGKSVNHHIINNSIKQAQIAHITLKDELDEVGATIDELAHQVEKLIIVKSNHCDFLDRYIFEGRYLNDPKNLQKALELATEMVKGKNPLKFGVESSGQLVAKNVQWLERDESFKVAGVELGNHGDKGANGAKGTLKGMETSYGNCVIGHHHTAEILRNAWCVGTCTYLKLDYNKGYNSNWTNTSCLIFANGAKQLINIIDGQWRRKDD
jgi:hypothetical protein